MTPAGIACALILLVAVGSHARTMPDSHLRAMAELRLPARLLDPVVAWAHVSAQIGVALLLFLEPLRIVAVVGVICLAVCYLTLAITRLGHTCRCFGGPGEITGWTIGRNASFLWLAVLSACPVTGWTIGLTVGAALAFVSCELVNRNPR